MLRFSNLRDRLRERRLGFRLDEVMSGEHEFEPGCGPSGRFPFEFRVTWGPDDILAWANPWDEGFLRQPLTGTVSVGGLCEDAPCEGTLELKYFDEHKLRYRFTFAAGGRRYRFVGEKVNIQPWNLPHSHTTCYGILTDEETGNIVSRSLTRFRLRTVPAFLASLRVA